MLLTAAALAAFLALVEPPPEPVIDCGSFDPPCAWQQPRLMVCCPA